MKRKEARCVQTHASELNPTTPQKYGFELKMRLDSGMLPELSCLSMQKLFSYKAVRMNAACLLWCSLHSGCSALFLVLAVGSILFPGFSRQSEYSYGGDSNFGPYSAASTVLEIITAMQTPGKVSWSAPLVLWKLIFRISTILAIKEYFCQWGLIILLSIMQLGNWDRGTSCNFWLDTWRRR